MKVMTKTKIKEITNEGLVVSDAIGKKRLLKTDNVVLALGMEANRDLTDELNKTGLKCYEIGDCIQPRRVAQAIHEAAHIAREI